MFCLGQGKSGSGKGASSSQGGKLDRKSPVASPKHHHGKDHDDDDQKAESSGPKVPPLKIVIPGGSCSGNRNEQEGEGTSFFFIAKKLQVSEC